MICLPHTMMFGWACQSLERPLNTMFPILPCGTEYVTEPLSVQKKGVSPNLQLRMKKKINRICAGSRKKGIGFSKSNFFRFAGDLASNRGTPFKNGRPSDKWWRLVKKRHNNISLRTPETTASVRNEMMTRVREPYFISLKAEMTTMKSPTKRV